MLRSKSTSSRGYSVAVDAVDVFDGSLVAAPQPVVTAEESDPRLAFAGDWLKATNTAMSGDAHTFASDVGARAVVTFFGRGIRWVSSLSPFNGLARVSIDGGAFQQVSLRSELAQYQKVVWSKSGLALGTHTVIIEVAKPALPGLAGPVPLDAVQIVGGSLQQAAMPWQRIEQTAPSITWAGAWTTGSSAILSGGSQRYSASPGARATFYFSGTSVRWIGARAPSYGKASVSIDGGTPLRYRPVRDQARVQAGASSDGRDCPNAQHTLIVRVLGSSRPGAKGRNVSIDAFDVAGVGRTP